MLDLPGVDAQQLGILKRHVPRRHRTAQIAIGRQPEGEGILYGAGVGFGSSSSPRTVRQMAITSSPGNAWSESRVIG